MKLKTLEAARAVAALLVLLFHFNAARAFIGQPTFGWMGSFVHGVDFFFVISGFIIFHVHREDIGKPGAAANYGLKRAIRLYPLLWLVAGGWIALRLATGAAVSGIGTSLLLYPSMVEPTPLPVWTLRHEVLFYAAFGVLVLNRTAGLSLFALWSIAALGQIALSLSGHPVEGLPSFFLSSYTLDFMMGAAVAFRFKEPSRKLWPFFAGLAVVVALLTVETIFGLGRADTLDYTTPGATVWVVILGAGFALLLYGLLHLEGRLAIPGWLVLLGGASYSLYLSHVPVLSIVQRTGSPVLMLAVPIVVALLIHLWFEKPVTRWLRRAMVRRPAEVL